MVGGHHLLLLLLLLVVVVVTSLLAGGFGQWRWRQNSWSCTWRAVAQGSS
jgi:hypothetical protein